MTTCRPSVGQRRRECLKMSTEGTSSPTSPPQTSTSATELSKCHESTSYCETSETCETSCNDYLIFGYEKKAALSHSCIPAKKRVNLLPPKLNYLLITILLVLMPMLVVAQPELSLPFNIGLGQSRFMNFAGSSARDNIRVFLIKNITEDIPVGEILATFRAEDKTSSTYNLT
jgi:hypothetical protein